MTATKNNGPPSSTLVMTVLVPRTSPSRNLYTPLLLPLASGAQSVYPTSYYFREFTF